MTNKQDSPFIKLRRILSHSSDNYSHSDISDESDKQLEFKYANQEILFGYQDPSLFRYMLFCAILANDHVALRNYLTGLDQLKYEWLWISTAELRYHEDNLHDGICKNAFYRTLWQDIDKKRLLNRPLTETNESNKYINLLEVACILRTTWETTNVIRAMLELLSSINEMELHIIICNTKLDASTAKSMIRHVKQRLSRHEDSYVSNCFGKLVTDLCELYVKCPFKEQPLILSKLCILLDPDLSRSICRIRFSPENLVGIMIKAINYSESALLLCCLNYIT